MKSYFAEILYVDSYVNLQTTRQAKTEKSVNQFQNDGQLHLKKKLFFLITFYLPVIHFTKF